MSTLEEIKSYQPFNEQEASDKQAMLSFLASHLDAYSRENLSGHMTASCWILNQTHDKVLFAFHNLYQSYAWLGGHADGEEDLLKVALKEAKEESGLSNVKPISKEIFSLEILSVEGHIKKEKYVPSHLHYNLTYLLEADENETLSIKSDENSSLAWFSFDEALKVSKEEWFVQNIYPKLIQKSLFYK